MKRIVIVNDGDKWHVRRLRRSVFDTSADEKIYFCDQPIANDFASLDDAVRAAKDYLE